MKIFKILFVIILYFTVTGFAVIKYPVNTERDNNFYVYRNSTVEYSININNENDFIGLILLVSVKNRTNFFIEIQSSDFKKNITVPVMPEERKYQTLKAVFDSFKLSGLLKIKISADSDFQIWYSNMNDNNQNSFIIAGEKIEGDLFLELIKPINLKSKLIEISRKIFRNIIFMIFYCICIFVIIILIMFNSTIKKKIL